jgi:DNA-binding winged helix-turn-helix (wHTH) protein
MSATTFRFDRFVRRPAERLLLRDGDPVLIGSRPFDLLRVLLEHAGELVSKVVGPIRP